MLPNVHVELRCFQRPTWQRMSGGRASSVSAAAGTLEAAGFPGAGHTAGFRGAAGVAEPTDAADDAAVVGDAESPDAADASGAADISRYSFGEKKGSKAINEFNSATTVGRYNKYVIRI